MDNLSQKLDTSSLSRPTSEDTELAANSMVKLPPFWAKDAHLWFARIEAQFCRSRITSDAAMFDHVVAGLEPDVATEVRDILIAPPAEQKYETLKKAIITRLTDSSSKRLQQVLHKEELGDRTPSQFWRHLQALADTTVGESVLRAIWFQRLPVNVQSILAGQDLGFTMNQLLAIADRVAEVSQMEVMPVVSQSDPLTQLTGQIDAGTLTGTNQSGCTNNEPFYPDHYGRMCVRWKEICPQKRNCRSSVEVQQMAVHRMLSKVP